MGTDLIIGHPTHGDDGEDSGMKRGASDNGDSPLAAVVAVVGRFPCVTPVGLLDINERIESTVR